jgi:cell division protein ftsW
VYRFFGNLAVVSNTIPVTGISLPLFSYGGSSVITIFIALGLLISISRVANRVEKENRIK